MTPVLVNPTAGSVDADLLDVLGRRKDVSIRQPQTAAAYREAVRESARSGASRVVVAGGDGTIHLAANALLSAHLSSKMVLGILPCGTGNDLARSLGLPDDPISALDHAVNGATRSIDVLKLLSGGTVRYAVNAAAGGFAGAVDEAVDDTDKDRFGPFAYLLGAAEALPELDGYRTALDVDGREETVDAVNVVLANGRTVAGGKEVASPARLDDGRMDVVVVHQGALPDLAAAGARLLAGTWLEHPLVSHRTARTVCIESTPPMQFNADGELWTDASLEATVEPGALRVAGGRADV